MTLGDGVRRNIATISPEERTMFKNALVTLNRRYYPGARNDTPNVGGVSYWFKQDEIHQATHVHVGPAFVPWHRELCNRFEALLRGVNSKLSLHYWNWTQDPRAIPNAGFLNSFAPDFMGYGGSASASIGEPWLSAKYYVPSAGLHRDATGNPADPPNTVVRSVVGSPATIAQDNDILKTGDFPTMRVKLENVHNAMHGFVNMGGQHVSFRDPFVFLLHSNVDLLFALWQLQKGQQWRLDPNQIYGTEGNRVEITENMQPWAGGTGTRPWGAPENQAIIKNCKHPTVVKPPAYDTNPVDLTVVVEQPADTAVNSAL
jgi:hypothetical protein